MCTSQAVLYVCMWNNTKIAVSMLSQRISIHVAVYSEYIPNEWYQKEEIGESVGSA